MSKRLYAAYGSNLNRAQMQRRCPTARLVGTGEIKDYELQFKGNPHGAFATVAPKKGSTVPVAVWELKPADELALDRYEGYPSHYFKSNVPVSMNGKDMRVMAYVMNQRMDFGLPSEFYYKTVSDGYDDCGLDKAALREAVGKSAESFYESSLTRPVFQYTFLGGTPYVVEDAGGSDIDIDPEDDEDFDLYGGAFDDDDEDFGDCDPDDDPDFDDGFGPFGGMSY